MKTPILRLAFLVFPLFSAGAQEATKKPICPPGQHWVRAYITSAYRRTDGTPVSASHTDSHCQDNPPAYAKWKDRLKSGHGSSEWAKHRKEKAWTDSERERVFEAISSIPDALASDSVQSIFRAVSDGTSSNNPAENDYGFVTLYDTAFTKGQNLARIIAHEFAHEAFRQLSDPERLDYSAKTGWIVAHSKSGKPLLISNRDGFVEEDGRESVTEDFANNVEYFLFDPKRLDRATPEAAAWIQRKYGDKLKLKKGAH